MSGDEGEVGAGNLVEELGVLNSVEWCGMVWGGGVLWEDAEGEEGLSSTIGDARRCGDWARRVEWARVFVCVFVHESHPGLV